MMKVDEKVYLGAVLYIAGRHLHDYSTCSSVLQPNTAAEAFQTLKFGDGGQWTW